MVASEGDIFQFNVKEKKIKWQVANSSIETQCFEHIPSQGLIFKIFFKIYFFN